MGKRGNAGHHDVQYNVKTTMGEMLKSENYLKLSVLTSDKRIYCEWSKSELFYYVFFTTKLTKNTKKL